MLINRCYPQQYYPMEYYKNSETRKAIDHYSYALNEEIGRGFSSKVYKGRDENQQTPVAVKVIDMKMVKQSIHATLLKNEISALKAFNSKNILQLYDVFQTQNNTYIITEYCDSGDLNNLIKKRGRLEESDALRLMTDILQGIGEINQKGYIHRDIKPANVLIDKGTPKVADFGFAIQVNSLEAKNQGRHYNVGTPLYMSPQALRQQGHTEKGDVWAIGVMFYEMLFGNPPFQAQTEQGLLTAILHHSLVLPSYPQISDASKDFIRRCLIVDENQRMRIKDAVTHQLVTRIERPLRQIQSQPAKDRSISQGIREFSSKQKFPTQVVNDKTNKRCPSEMFNLPPPPSNIVEAPKLNDMRSKSQKQILEGKKIVQEQKVDSSEVVYDKRNLRKAQTILQERPQNMQTQPSMSSNASAVQSPMKFKANNDILFSQINFCRFLYKFSQQLMSQKTLNLSSGLREKLLFLMSKNIAMKINKLNTLTEKENIKENHYGLEDLEQYRKSESFSKFSQAIQEYNEKYRKHFEKMFNFIQKQNLTQDKKFEALFDKDLNEFESFYFITQSYIRQALQDIRQELPQDEQLDSNIPDENIFVTYVAVQFCNYLQICHTVLLHISDFRKFSKAIKIESMVDYKQNKTTFRQIDELKSRIHELITH